MRLVLFCLSSRSFSHDSTGVQLLMLNDCDLWEFSNGASFIIYSLYGSREHTYVPRVHFHPTES